MKKIMPSLIVFTFGSLLATLIFALAESHIANHSLWKLRAALGCKIALASGVGAIAVLWSMVGIAKLKGEPL